MASARELEWWDRFAGVMARQWNLTPSLNRAIRADYERDYEEYLFTPGGTLLDVGCGTGARTHGLARRGMEVDGIDFSRSQLELATMLADHAGLPSMRFFQRDIVNEAWSGRRTLYDGIFVNALLHHLSYEELGKVFARMGAALKPGGRVYLYEPIVRSPEAWGRHLVFRAVDLVWRLALATFIRTGRSLALFDREFTRAMEQGYTGTSPDEHAIELNRLSDCWRDGFELVECRPVHEYSIAYSMAIMLLERRAQQRLERFAPALYAADQWLLRRGMWENAGTDRRWILCAVKLRRTDA